MKINYIAIIICLIVPCVSCNEYSSVKDVLKGMWSIDNITYNNDDLGKCGLLNVVNFNENSTVDLPISKETCFDLIVTEKAGNYDVLLTNDNTNKLIIKTGNTFFNDTFQMTFMDDKVNRLLKLNLKSKNKNITLTKGLFNHVSKMDDVKKLINVE